MIMHLTGLAHGTQTRSWLDHMLTLEALEDHIYPDLYDVTVLPPNFWTYYIQFLRVEVANIS